jgi:hypothetical protein
MFGWPSGGEIPLSKEYIMFSRLGGGLVVLVVAACLSQQATAQSYLPGPPPTVGDIQHQTVSPFNPGRTDIGIGEKVNCWIDPSTWSDPDIYIDPYGNQSTVYDTMGTVTWSTTGAGSVYPTTGEGTTLTADLTDADDTVTVQATVHDSGTKGLDAALVKTMAFALFAPTGRFIISHQDLNTFGTAPPPIAVIGCRTVFEEQVQPTTVDFGPTGGNVTFNENLPGDTWTWPNGTPGSTPPDDDNEFTVRTVATLANRCHDVITAGSASSYPIALLSGKAFTVTIRVPLEYLDATGHWVPFFPNETHDKSFLANGSGRAIDNTNNTVLGGFMGPWASTGP